jgi:hypothetical protein
MKGSVAATVTALVLLFASSAVAQTPTQDSVTGSGSAGTTLCCSIDFRIDAHSGPSGEGPTGTAALVDRFGTFEGSVTCVAVNGNAATLNFVVFSGTAAAVVTYTVTDSPAGDRLDFRANVRAPTDCAPLTSVADVISGGDIVVVDALPQPTNKDQCKNGGWKTFRVFKNQGDCVSYVTTKGKNAPAKEPG